MSVALTCGGLMLFIFGILEPGKRIDSALQITTNLLACDAELKVQTA